MNRPRPSRAELSAEYYRWLQQRIDAIDAFIGPRQPLAYFNDCAEPVYRTVLR